MAEQLLLFGRGKMAILQPKEAKPKIEFLATHN
jgi:hypothetical protein